MKVIRIKRRRGGNIYKPGRMKENIYNEEECLKQDEDEYLKLEEEESLCVRKIYV